MAGRRTRRRWAGLVRATAAAAVVLAGGAGCASSRAGGPQQAVASAPPTSPSAVPDATASTPAPVSTAPSAPTTAEGRPATTAAAATRPRTAGSGSLAGRIIAIDPGHNGANGSHASEIARPVDAGGFTKACNTTGTATDAGYSESAFNFATAQALRTDLEALGAQVFLTRNDDSGVGPCVDVRGQFGAKVHADLMVSIHADGAAAPGHGFHVIHPTVISGYTDDIVGPSGTFATEMRDALVAAGLTPSTYTGSNGVVARGDLGTLNRSDVPVVMVECANMRNPADAALVSSAAGRARIATGLAAGIARFLTTG